MTEWVPSGHKYSNLEPTKGPFSPNALFLSLLLQPTKTSFSHNTLFLSPFLQPTKNPILEQRSLPLPIEPLSPRGATQATSSSSSDEREDPQLSDEEEAEQRPIRVVVDTSSDDSKFVEQNEIQDHVPLKHRAPRKSDRGAKGQGCGSTTTD
jgi:hypothetical protein